jgi:hypothetical protein
MIWSEETICLNEGGSSERSLNKRPMCKERLKNQVFVKNEGVNERGNGIRLGSQIHEMPKILKHYFQWGRFNYPLVLNGWLIFTLTTIPFDISWCTHVGGTFKIFLNTILFYFFWTWGSSYPLPLVVLFCYTHVIILP